MKLTKINIKLFILGLVGFIFFIVMVLFVLTLNAEEQNNKKVPSIMPTSVYSLNTNNPTPKVPIPAPTRPTFEVDEYSSGVVPNQEEMYLKQNPETEELQSLRNLTPIENNSFLLEYSYANVVFMVYLKEPIAQNRIVFLNFLKDRGILRSLEKFEFTQF
jgi:hypothetical protein